MCLIAKLNSAEKSRVKVTKGPFSGKLGYCIPWGLNTYNALPADEGKTSYFYPVVLDQDLTEVHWFHDTILEVFKD